MIDGGVKLENFEECIKDGATILVMGSAIFKAENPGSVIQKVKETIKKYEQS